MVYLQTLQTFRPFEPIHIGKIIVEDICHLSTLFSSEHVYFQFTNSMSIRLMGTLSYYPES